MIRESQACFIAMRRGRPIINAMRKETLMRMGLSLLALLAGAQPVLGQAADEYPTPALEDKVAWWCILCTVVFVVASVAVAFKNSRRTHLD